MSKKKLFRITTVPVSLSILLKGQLKYVSTYFDVTAVSSPGAQLNEVGNRENVKVIPIKMTRTISPLADIAALWRLYQVFKKNKPFIVHTHTPKAGLIGMVSAWFASVPVRLHTVAGMPVLEARGLKRTLLFAMERMTYFFAHRVYPNSFELKKIIEQNDLCASKKLKVLGNGSSNGIDVDYFNPNAITELSKQEILKDFNICQTDFIYCFVGRIVKDKGIDELVAAFDKLSGEVADITLLLVGEFEDTLNPISEHSRQIIKVNSKIICTDFQPDVRPFLAISSVFVFPSYREGFPNVVMQAGAMGLFSIVTNINGCNEIIIDGRNGSIIPVKNEQRLLDSLKYAYSIRKELTLVRSEIRKLIVDRYDQQFLWNLILKEYSEFEIKTRVV